MTKTTQKRKSQTKRKSATKRTSKGKKIAAGLTGVAGLTALVALAYKKGLFDELAQNVQKLTTNYTSPQISQPVQMESVPQISDIPAGPGNSVGPEQGPLPNPVQKQYMLQSISKVLMKPISEIEQMGLSQDDIRLLMKNNINIEDIKSFVRIKN